LTILQAMTQQQEIEQLQRELEQLSRDVQMQQEKILSLQQRIARLSGSEIKLPSSKPQGLYIGRFSIENFIGLRLIHFVGIVVLVIGLSIGVKYAIDRNLISEAMRITLAYVAGVLLFGLSLWLRKKYSLFSAILFSGGMASLYFTTYAAFVYYSIFSFGFAFALMVALTFYTVYEAIRYDRQEIALLGLVGAYGIPFLISKNADRADLFFLYISMINLGVVFLSVKKVWKHVGRIAQAITWIIFIGWSSLPAHQKFFGIASATMVFFFLLFLFNSVAPKIFHRMKFTLNDAYQIVLNTIALYIATLFLFGYDSIITTSTAMITLVIATVAAAQSLIIVSLWKDESFTVRMLSSLAFILFALFIYFNWDGFTVTLLWLLTSVVVFAWGFRMKSVTARLLAMVLIGVTLAKLLAFDSLSFTTVQKVIAYLILGVLLLIVSFFYQKFRQQLFSDRE
jgi:uncharacterized membrane protein